LLNEQSITKHLFQSVRTCPYSWATGRKTLLANPTNNKLQRRLMVNTVSETQQKQTKNILRA